MDRRQATIALAALGIAARHVIAQPAFTRRRVAFLGVSSAREYAPLVDAFIRSLRDLGYEEGRNVVFDYRWADGHDERLPALAAELLRLKPDVVVTHATGVAAVQRATSTVPIVMGASADPVGFGLVESLAKPGGNTTGVASQIIDLASKRLELLKEAVTTLEVVAVLSHLANPAARRGLAETETGARKLNVRVVSFGITAEAHELEALFVAIARERARGLIVQPDPMTGKHSARIAKLALQNRLPAIGGVKQFAVDGGLMAYGADFVEGWRLAARFVHRILQGTKPADLPVEQPMAFELAVNARTAQTLGLTLPPALLVRAEII
jgi:putative ABC transport system substrate-binding protein